MKPLASPILGVRQFVAAYWWVIRDHLPGHRRQVGLVALLSAIGALAQGGTIAFIAFAVDSLDNSSGAGSRRFAELAERLGEPLGPWLARLTNDRAAMLLVFGVGLLILVLTGAWAAYAAIVRTRAQGRSFHVRCSKRCLVIASNSSALDHSSRPDDAGRLKRLIMRDSIFLGKALETILRSLEPVFRMVVLAVMLFTIEMRLTLWIAPLFLILLPMIYGLGRRVKRNSMQFYEGTLVEMHRRVISMLSLIDRLGLPFASRGRGFDEVFEVDPQVREYLDDFDRIQLTHERVQVAIASVGSLMIVGALLAGGYLAQQQALSWGLVLAYMLGLQQALVGFRVVMSQVASLTLYYPSAERHLRFYEGAPDPAAEPAAAFTPPPPARITVDRDSRLPGSEPSFVVEPGEPVFYVCEWQLGRINIKRVLEPLVEAGFLSWSSLRSEISFVGPRAMLPPESIRSLLVGRDSDGRSEVGLQRSLERLGVNEELASLPGGMEAVLTPELQEGISDSLKMALTLLPALGDARSVLLLDMWLLHRAGKEPARAMLELLGERMLLLCTTGLALPRALAGNAIVSQEGRVTGAGSLDWFETVKTELKSIGKTAAASAAEDDLDFDD